MQPDNAREWEQRELSKTILTTLEISFFKWEGSYFRVVERGVTAVLLHATTSRSWRFELKEKEKDEFDESVLTFYLPAKMKWGTVETSPSRSFFFFSNSLSDERKGFDSVHSGL
jgi:hypothetical protein